MVEDAVRLVPFLILIMVIDTGACILDLEAAVRGHKLRCGESTMSVWTLVLGPALLLVMAQLLACWVSGDLDGPEAIRDRQLIRTCLAFSWLTIIYGIPILLVGALCSSCANCYPASKYCLPIGGIGLLCLACMLANLLGGSDNCICSQKDLQKASPSWQLTMACLFLTWVAVAIGLSMLLIDFPFE